MLRIELLGIDKVRFNDSTRNYQERRTRQQMTCRRALRSVREQAERQAGGFEQSDSRVVAKQRRSVAGVGIADRPQIFVVTTNEGRTTPQTAAQDGEVHLVAQFDHGGGLVEVLSGKKFG